MVIIILFLTFGEIATITSLTLFTMINLFI